MVITGMISVDYGNYHRLGNIMFMRIAAWIFANKHNYFLDVTPTIPFFKNNPNDPDPVNTGFGEPWCSIKIKTNSGEKRFNEPTIVVNNGNYLSLLESENIPDARYFFQDYFQYREFIAKYSAQIKSFFELTYTPVDPKEIFVAVRLGDATNSRARLPRAYYEDAITQLYDKGCYGGYITSESIDHPDIVYLKEKFNLKTYINHTPMEKINFAKNFNNLVLSEGSFSFWMGFLSNAENIYINDRRHLWTWHGDIFVFPEWKRLCYDSPELPG